MAHILELDLFNFRNFVEQKIEFCPEFNFIFGQNASGKTSLLEAIYLLGNGKSFRTTHANVCINHLHTEYIVRAKINNLLYYPHDFWIAMQRERNGAVLYKVADNLEKKLSNFVKYLPVQFVDINSYKIIEEAPSLRREYLDWLLFHTITDYAEVWQRMKKSLEQRNVLLKSGFFDSAQLGLWTKSFVLYAEIVDQLRQEVVSNLATHLIKLIKQYYAVNTVEIIYQKGWGESFSLQEILEQEVRLDLMRKNTHSGPHKADFKIIIDGHPVKEIFSRGQIKLLTFLMMQARMLVLQRKSVFLIDDLSAELDSWHITKVLNSLSLLECQVIISAIDQKIAQLLDCKIKSQHYLLQNSKVDELVVF